MSLTPGFSTESPIPTCKDIGSGMKGTMPPMPIPQVDMVLNLNLYSLKQPHRIFQSKKARRAAQVINRMVNGQQRKYKDGANVITCIRVNRQKGKILENITGRKEAQMRASQRSRARKRAR